MRVAFCQQQAANSDSLPVAFTNESRVAQDWNRGAIWRTKGEILEEGFYENDHRSFSEMVWGVIGMGFHGWWSRCPHSMDQTVSKEILCDTQIFETLSAQFGGSS
jgi:hypothetical protein